MNQNPPFEARDKRVTEGAVARHARAFYRKRTFSARTWTAVTVFAHFENDKTAA
jgi:hypothetical protein